VVTSLPQPHIIINNQEYRLARKEVLERVGRARSWQMERGPQATQVTPRRDVRPGQLPDEYVITWDDFSRGVGPDRNAPPGVVHYTYNLEGTTMRLRPVGHWDSLTVPTDDWLGDPAIIVEHLGIKFLIAGRYCYRLRDDSNLVQIRDFGAGVVASDAVVWNNELIVAFSGEYGASFTRIQKQDASSVWTTATDNVYASYFAIVGDRLWRAHGTSPLALGNQVSNIAPGANPFTLLNWSAGITVGDNSTDITDLNALGLQIAVSKQNGLHIGDEAALFPNVLPQMENAYDHENGKSTLVIGDTIFYPHRHGLIRWSPGDSEELGLEQQLSSVRPEAPTSLATGIGGPPGFAITALAAQGRYIWAATRPSYQPRALPTGFKKTINSGGAYTSYTTNVTDRAIATAADLSSLDTFANGDWVIIGYSAKFWAVVLEITSPHLATSVMTIQVWTGAAWTTLPVTSVPWDNTRGENGESLSRSGVISWRQSATTDSWAASTIDGTNAFWVRLSWSTVLGSNVKISEARVVTEQPTSYVFRLRPRTLGDVYTQSYVWEPYFAGFKGTVTAINFSRRYPYARGGNLLIASKQYLHKPPLPLDPGDPIYEEDTSGGLTGVTGVAILPIHDAGMPQVNKQFSQIRAIGRNVGTVVTIAYRTGDVGGAWTGFLAINSSPDSFDVSLTAYSIQLAISMGTYSSDSIPELERIEVVFRALPVLKDVFTCVLELADGQSNAQGGQLLPARDQLTVLEALTGTMPLVDPVQSPSRTVTLHDLKVLEWVQEGLDFPVLAVEAKLVEV
jgi:hypothetical protein